MTWDDLLPDSFNGRRIFLKSSVLAGAYSLAPRALRAQAYSAANGNQQTLNIRTEAGSPFPHVWEECIGSDRAVVGLRQQWLSDLEVVRKAAGIKSVRFHGLFNDEMGVWPAGAKQPNFLYVDMVFDAMLERGVKPLVELSFMPGALASGTRTLLWYRGNTTPPKDVSQWGELVGALAKHSVDRYGIGEVSTWSFEVWNEPNIVFWAGTQADYFELYRQSVMAIKQVDKRLRVGGPSTARAAWVPEFLNFCSSQQLPIDFVSTHVYPDDPQKLVFGQDVHYPVEEVIPKALSMIREQIKASKFPDSPLFVTEWSSQNPAFIAHIVATCAGLADMMSYWTFDNVYEELGVPKSFLNPGFGLLGMRGVPRPSFYTFSLLHRLGDIRLRTDDGPVLATRRKDGSLAILVWNLIPQAPGVRSSMGDPLSQSAAQYETAGEKRRLVLKLEGAHKHGRANVTRVDETSGNFRNAYQKTGSPAYPTQDQIQELKRASELMRPETIVVSQNGEISLDLPPNGVALIEC
jgi:xylan 1,4-beta-xylosidase